MQVGIYGRIDDRQQAHLLALEPQSAWASRARRPEFPNQRILGAARYLAETRNFDGTVVFIFQPAEEGLGGARAMLADGLFERFPCDEIYALHNAPEGPQGQISVHSGPMMAGADFFESASPAAALTALTRTTRSIRPS